MKIKGNITQKDNNKLVYANLILMSICAFLVFVIYGDRNNKELILVDSAHEIYNGRMIRVPDVEAREASVKAHVKLGFTYLYNLSEYNYEDHIEWGLHLWAYEGANIVKTYEREKLFDLLNNTPTRIECKVIDLEVLGETMTAELRYPEIVKDTLTGDIAFIDQLRNDVLTYLVRSKTEHFIVRGSTIISREIHIEELEIYTGFDIDVDLNPFGMKSETITREVTKL